MKALRLSAFVIPLALALFSPALRPVGAQQLTRIALVDLGKVYTEFFRDSRAVREFEEKTARVRSEVERMTGELQNLQKKKLEADENADSDLSLTLGSEISRKASFLKEYYRIKMAELETEKKNLANSDSFMQQVYNELRKLGEGEGYSLVVDIKELPGILWYSQTIDITDMLIEKLRAQSNRQ